MTDLIRRVLRLFGGRPEKQLLGLRLADRAK